MLIRGGFNILTHVTNLFDKQNCGVRSLGITPDRSPHFSQVAVIMHRGRSILSRVVGRLRGLIGAIRMMSFHGASGICQRAMLAHVNMSSTAQRRIVRFYRVLNTRVISIAQSTLAVRIAKNRCGVSHFLSLVRSCSIRVLAQDNHVTLPGPYRWGGLPIFFFGPTKHSYEIFFSSSP